MTKCMVERVLHYHIRERFNCRCSLLALFEHLVLCLPEHEPLLLLQTFSSLAMRFTCPVQLSKDTANLRLVYNCYAELFSYSAIPDLTSELRKLPRLMCLRNAYTVLHIQGVSANKPVLPSA
jgi:hypothetical protein